MDGSSGRPSGPQRLGDIARRLIRGRMSKRARREGRILEVWEQVAGQELAGKLKPVRLRAGVLWVDVESPAVLYEAAQFSRKAMLGKLRELLPDLGVEDMRFRLG